MYQLFMDGNANSTMIYAMAQSGFKHVCHEINAIENIVVNGHYFLR